MLPFLHKHLDKNANELWDLAFQETKWPRKVFYSPKREKVEVLLTMTTCKRFDLFEQTLHSILHTWTDIDQVDAWFCVDDNSSTEDRHKMRSYDWIEYYMKRPSEKGHRTSMNLIWNKIKEVNPTYWIHIEDDFVFHVERSYVADAIRGLQVTGASQLLYNRNYAETIHDYRIEGHIPVTEEFCMHEYKTGTLPYQNCHYWPHYSFRPGMTKVDVVLQLGNFDSANTFFEMDYAYRWMNAGHKTGFYNAITCQHIGKLTKDKSKPNAYALNQCNQFHESHYIKVVNLERRKDRKEKMADVLKDISYELVKAVDGNTLTITPEIMNLFMGNDFDNRKGVIGCALSHYYLWKQLVQDSVEYYVVLEDDITITPDFKTKIEKIESKEVCFLGYHMYSKDRDASYDAKDGCVVQPFQGDLFVGGTFGYYITKKGAQRLLDYVAIHGIKHGIDYVMKLATVDCMECKPHLVFSEWNEYYLIDSDIQGNYDAFHLSSEEFIFLEKVDHVNDDIERCEQNITDKAKPVNVAGFNSLGYLKSAINIHTLRPSAYFKETDGIYVKREYHALQKLIRVKMLCNWCTSEELCKQWSKMAEYNYTWKHIQMVWEGDYEYCVILNSTLEQYDPAKTIVYQMEPWVKDETKHWGVKTWGDWIEPKCAYLRGRKTSHLNTIQWLVEQTYDDWSKPIQKTKNLSTICTSKFWDEGHVLRINMLLYFEKNGVEIDIYGKENTHQFSQYKGPLEDTEKSKGVLPYKYYFMMENSFEVNYASEKIWEPILSESLCFYYGCRNLSDYIDPRAYVQLERDCEKSYQLVTKAMQEDWYTQRLPYIKAAKRDILNRLYFFPTLYTDIQRLRRPTVTLDYRRVCVIHAEDTESFERIYKAVMDRIYLFDRVFIQTTTPMNIQHSKVSISYTNPYAYQLETMNLIRMISEKNDIDVLYLHTGPVKTPQEKDWMNMILYFLVEKAEDCLRELKEHDTVGCNLEVNYGGNCWWTKSSYVRTLSYLPIIYPKDALTWLCMNQLGKHFEIHSSGLNHKEYCYPTFLYKF